MEKLTTLTMNGKIYDSFAGNLPQPAEAVVGQFITVSAVDEDGKVTEVEAVTIPNAEGVSF